MNKEEQKNLNDELFTASRYGWLKKVKDLIKSGAEVEARTESRTPLYGASTYGHLDVVKYLIEEAKAEVDARDNHGRTPLYGASYNGQLVVVKYLVEEAQADVDARDNHGCTPFYAATNYGPLEVVKYLVEEANVDVDARTHMGNNILYLTAVTEQREVLEFLFLDRNALMLSAEMFKFPELMKMKMKRETEAQSIFDYFLQNKSRYNQNDIKEFKTKFLKFEMCEEDTQNLKTIVKFL